MVVSPPVFWLNHLAGGLDEALRPLKTDEMEASDGRDNPVEAIFRNAVGSGLRKTHTIATHLADRLPVYRPSRTTSCCSVAKNSRFKRANQNYYCRVSLVQGRHIALRASP